MTLKSKFIILVLSALIMPILSMAGVFMIFRSNIDVPDPVSTVRAFEKELEQLDSPDDFPALVEAGGEAFFGIMIDDPGSMYSSGGFITDDTGSPISPNGFRHQIALNRYIRHFDDGSEVLFLFGVDMTRIDKRLLPLAFFITSLLVLSLISILIIRSINNSVSGLEEVTRHIAQGNLDAPIDTSGRDKFGSLARSLDSMRDQIKMEYDRRNRFFMGISHDLKTPLASITGYADALMEGMADNREAMNKYLGIIKEKSCQLEQGITRVIHYMKLSNFDFQANLQELSLSVFLKNFLDLHIEEAGFHGDILEGQIDISDDLLFPFDEILLGRALENLIQNAYRYGRDGEPVKLFCYKDYGSIVIVVENEGQQITEEHLSHLFEPFFRGNKSRKGEGFGLGLSSVKSIVESHDWSITVDSKEKRTRFIIAIPLPGNMLSG